MTKISQQAKLLDLQQIEEFSESDRWNSLSDRDADQIVSLVRSFNETVDDPFRTVA